MAKLKFKQGCEGSEFCHWSMICHSCLKTIFLKLNDVEVKDILDAYYEREFGLRSERLAKDGFFTKK